MAAQTNIKQPQYKHKEKSTPQSQPFPIVIENITGLRATNDVWPSYRGVFTGSSVIVSQLEDAEALYLMGCFGQPSTAHFLSPGPKILRRRVYKVRQEWASKAAIRSRAVQGEEESESSDSSEDIIPIVTPLIKKQHIRTRKEYRVSRDFTSAVNGPGSNRQWYSCNWDDQNRERETTQEEEERPRKRLKLVSDDDVVILSDSEEPAEKENNDPNQQAVRVERKTVTKDGIELVSIEDDMDDSPQTELYRVKSDDKVHSVHKKALHNQKFDEDVTCIDEVPEKMINRVENECCDIEILERRLSNSERSETEIYNSSAFVKDTSSTNIDENGIYEMDISDQDSGDRNKYVLDMKSNSTEKDCIDDKDIYSNRTEPIKRDEGTSITNIENQLSVDSDSDDFHLRISDDEEERVSENGSDKCEPEIIELDIPESSHQSSMVQAVTDSSDEAEIIELDEDCTSSSECEEDCPITEGDDYEALCNEPINTISQNDSAVTIVEETEMQENEISSSPDVREVTTIQNAAETKHSTEEFQEHHTDCIQITTEDNNHKKKSDLENFKENVAQDAANNIENVFKGSQKTIIEDSKENISQDTANNLENVSDDSQKTSAPTNTPEILIPQNNTENAFNDFQRTVSSSSVPKIPIHESNTESTSEKPHEAAVSNSEIPQSVTENLSEDAHETSSRSDTAKISQNHTENTSEYPQKTAASNDTSEIFQSNTENKFENSQETVISSNVPEISQNNAENSSENLYEAGASNNNPEVPQNEKENSSEDIKEIAAPNNAPETSQTNTKITFKCSQEISTSNSAPKMSQTNTENVSEDSQETFTSTGNSVIEVSQTSTENTSEDSQEISAPSTSLKMSQTNTENATKDSQETFTPNSATKVFRTSTENTSENSQENSASNSTSEVSRISTENTSGNSQETSTPNSALKMSQTNTEKAIEDSQETFTPNSATEVSRTSTENTSENSQGNSASSNTSEVSQTGTENASEDSQETSTSNKAPKMSQTNTEKAIEDSQETFTPNSATEVFRTSTENTSENSQGNSASSNTSEVSQTGTENASEDSQETSTSNSAPKMSQTNTENISEDSQEIDLPNSAPDISQSNIENVSDVSQEEFTPKNVPQKNSVINNFSENTDEISIILDATETAFSTEEPLKNFFVNTQNTSINMETSEKASNKSRSKVNTCRGAYGDADNHYNPENEPVPVKLIIISDSDCEGDKSELILKWKPEQVEASTAYSSCDENLILSLEEAFFLMQALGCLSITSPSHHLHRLLPPQPLPDPRSSPQPGPSSLNNFPDMSAVFGLSQVCDERAILTPEIAWQLFANTQDSFPSRYVIYHHYRAHNFVVRSGLKFGGDFLLYREGPSRTHASYIVLIARGDSHPLSLQNIMTANRIAQTTRKEVLVSWVQWPESGPSLQNLSKVCVWEKLVTRIRPTAQHLMSSSSDDEDLEFSE